MGVPTNGLCPPQIWYSLIHWAPRIREYKMPPPPSPSPLWNGRDIFIESWVTQPHITWFCQNLVCWCIMVLMVKATGGMGGLKWQCVANCILFYMYVHCYSTSFWFVQFLRWLHKLRVEETQCRERSSLSVVKPREPHHHLLCSTRCVWWRCWNYNLLWPFHILFLHMQWNEKFM